MSLLVVPEVEEIGGMSPADLEACVRGFEAVRRRLDAQLAVLVNRVEVSGAFVGDHHRTVRAC